MKIFFEKFILIIYLTSSGLHCQSGNVSISNGAVLTIEKNSSLTVSGSFSNTESSVILNSDSNEFSSIIVKGNTSGDITYNRHINAVGINGWDLIGSPVEDLQIARFTTTNMSSIATNVTSSSTEYAVGFFDNSSNSWVNYNNSTIESAGNFTLGQGYQMASNSGESLSFTGKITNAIISQRIINYSESGGSRWTLISNPYPSYVNANISADEIDNFLTVNSCVIDDNYEGIYGYDGDGTGYTVYNNTSSTAIYLAPGQAFFVASATNNGSSRVFFTSDMQTTSGGDDFILNSNSSNMTENPKIQLSNDGENQTNNSSSNITDYVFSLKLFQESTFRAETKFYFKEGLTLGLDPGYDAGAFDQSIDLMSCLVESDQGIGMAINAMSIDSINDVSIPLIVNRSSTSSFMITLVNSTLPSNIKVYLEDRLQETLTELNLNDFTLKPNTTLNGKGRFFLHISSNSLSYNTPIDPEAVKIYKQTGSNYITIEGLKNTKEGIAKLYNSLGQQILNQPFSGQKETEYLSVAGIPFGVYILKLETNHNNYTKKIIVYE